jgi:hypothetical protein
LGLPTPKGRLNKVKFKSTKERLIKRFTNWTERNMLKDRRRRPEESEWEPISQTQPMSQTDPTCLSSKSIKTT